MIKHISVVNKIAKYLLRDGPIICGNSGYQISFTFDSEWDAYETKTARFIWNGQYVDKNFTGTTCDVPILKNTTQLEVGVYAGNLRTTTSASIECVKSVLCGTEAPTAEEEHYTTAAEEAARRAEASAASAARSESAIGMLEDTITRNSKRISNLEQRIDGELFVTDNSTAYVKDVPGTALPYAEISKFGGQTYKNENLIPYPYHDANQTHNGITYTINNDGTITANGTATNTSFFILALSVYLPAGEYTINSDTNLGFPAHMRWGNEVYDKTFTSTGEARDIEIRIDSGTTLNNVTFKPMLNRGDTALPYEPYYEGLRHAKPTAFKSVGANLWNSGDIVANGYNAEINNVFENLKPNKPYALSWDYTSNGTESAQDVIIVYTDAGGFNIANGASFTITEEQINTFTIAYGYFGSDATSGSMTNIMLNEGETALPYKPYREPITLAIPTAVQNIDGYGYGVNENVYNCIEWKPDEAIKKYHKACGVVDLGTLAWEYSTGGATRFQAKIPSNAKQSMIDAVASNIICSKYTTGSADAVYAGEAGICFAETNIWVCDTNYTDAATFKEAMQGVMLIYELATPKVTDISDILPDDNLIAVEGGGTIIVENDYGYDVPSEITYQLEVAE